MKKYIKYCVTLVRRLSSPKLKESAHKRLQELWVRLTVADVGDCGKGHTLNEERGWHETSERACYLYHPNSPSIS
jgi:hypothetical protein